MSWNESSPALRILLLLMLAIGCSAQSDLATEPAIGVLSLSADGRIVDLSDGRLLQISPFASQIDVRYGLSRLGDGRHEGVRIRFKLEGVDTEWREADDEGCFMRLSVVFLNQSGNVVGAKDFQVRRESAGWTGSFETSPLQHRREQVVVPADVSRLWIVISSAGGRGVIGAYFVGNLTLQTMDATGVPERDLIKMEIDTSSRDPRGWLRGGLRTGMAKVVAIDYETQRKGLAILDDDPAGHAQWNTVMGTGPRVAPMDVLVLEWDEMYSVGWATPAAATYTNLQPGFYRFALNRLSLMGVPTREEISMGFEVLLPFWRTPWFWVSIGLIIAGTTFAGWRYWESRKLQMANIRLEQQRVVEAERFRIARDIHDDFGTRVTEISLFSSDAQKQKGLSSEAAADFGTIAQMSRNLVSSLYETVWAVSPENDNLEALVSYVCQMAEQLCGHVGLNYRLEIPDLPEEVAISANIRHNLVMVVKEAIHNVIRHAEATEVQIRIWYADRLLAIELEDNGKGFDPNAEPHGRGLVNMLERISALGGVWVQASEPDGGCRIRLELRLQENGGSANSHETGT